MLIRVNNAQIRVFRLIRVNSAQTQAVRLVGVNGAQIGALGLLGLLEETALKYDRLVLLGLFV